MVGLDVTRQVVVHGEEIRRLGQVDAPLASWLHDALAFYLEFHHTYEKLDGCVVNDVLPIAELLRPGTLTFESMSLVVDHDEGAKRGRTRVDSTGAGVPTRVATSVRADAARQLLFERVLPWLAPVGAA
jgi:inosine-uridine nucleoside N-ribohydrolase